MRGYTRYASFGEGYRPPKRTNTWKPRLIPPKREPFQGENTGSRSKLDLNATLFSERHRIPNPDLFSDKEKISVIAAFGDFQRRRPKPILEELTDPKRIKFEQIIFQKLGIDNVMQNTIDTLIDAVGDRTNRRRIGDD